MAVPVMFGASGLKLVKFLAKGAVINTTEWAVMITGFVVTFFVSVWAIKFLIGYIKKHDFKPFGIYRIILGIIVIIAVATDFLPM